MAQQWFLRRDRIPSARLTRDCLVCTVLRLGYCLSSPLTGKHSIEGIHLAS